MKPTNNLLLSAIIGDIAGSTYEFNPCRNYNNIVLPNPKSFFTDDTVCTIAIADALTNGKDLASTLKQWCRNNPRQGYGCGFAIWIHSDNSKPYNSFGNGSAMRVSSCAFAAKTEDECLELAKWSAEVTHNHPEGIKGAQAAALTTFALMHGKGKDFVRDYILPRFYPGFCMCSIEEMKIGYEFNETCQNTVPQSIACFLESKSYEDCIRLCISMGADADTMGAIAGPMAYAYYGEMSQEWIDQALSLLPKEMKDVITDFDSHVANGKTSRVESSVANIEKNPVERIAPNVITSLQQDEVFVFGSNLKGMHGGGAARTAHQHFGAEWGVGVGVTGQCYAIPTMHGGIEEIRPYVDDFIAYARSQTDKRFLVTRIGCGIAGFRDEDIAPLFIDAIACKNVYLPESFLQIINQKIESQQSHIADIANDIASKSTI